MEKNCNSIHVEGNKFFFRLIDGLLKPIMFFLGGCHKNGIQETHQWHIQKIDKDLISLSDAIIFRGNDTSKLRKRYLFLFHIAFIGGWKNYSVYEVQDPSPYFHIGWIIYEKDTKHLSECAIQTLPIYGKVIRLLNGISNYEGYIFAVNAFGDQIPIKRIDEGVIGDKKNAYIRLF